MSSSGEREREEVNTTTSAPELPHRTPIQLLRTMFNALKNSVTFSASHSFRSSPSGSTTASLKLPCPNLPSYVSSPRSKRCTGRLRTSLLHTCGGASAGVLGEGGGNVLLELGLFTPLLASTLHRPARQHRLYTLIHSCSPSWAGRSWSLR